MTPPRLTYWWRGALDENGNIVAPQENWGDRSVYTLLNALGTQPRWRPPAEATFVLLGSVLEHLPPGWDGTVCGAGKLREDSVVDLSAARVLALRGKLTAASVTIDEDTPPVLGDPALLMPRFIRQQRAWYDVGVLPHWSDHELAARYSYAHVIDPTWRPEMVVEHITKCKRLISSSLHGLVVADAYGIPRQAELFPNAAAEGGDFKYRDYASVYDEPPHFGEMWLAPHDLVERVQGQLLRVLEQALDLDSRLPVPSRDAADRTKWHRRGRRRHPQVSVIVPYRDDGEQRARLWNWLRQYWQEQLPQAEIIEGHDASVPFNKCRAVNRAASNARGRVFVVVDADTYIDAAAVQNCVDDIDAAVSSGRRRWYVPYDQFHRLTRATTEMLLRTDPGAPYWLPSPPPPGWLEDDNSANYGYQYGAGIQIMPREAFFLIGGWDPRFRFGWGSEDGAAMRALDTLYAQHEVMRNDLVHLWHVRPGTDWQTRTWVGQTPGVAHSRLAQRYANATGEPGFMRALVDEHVAPSPHATPRAWERLRFPFGRAFGRGGAP